MAARFRSITLALVLVTASATLDAVEDSPKSVTFIKAP